MKPSVVYVVPDKMGGMMNIVANLLAHRDPNRFEHRVVLTRNDLSADAPFAGTLDCDAQTTLHCALPLENLHTVMRRLARAIGTGPGVVVAGDQLDLATLSVHDTGKAVVLILHGDHDYYYDIAVAHDRVVHAYITYSQQMYRTLRERLPHRGDSIFHLPYGIPIPERVSHPSAGPLRLVFAGRLEHGQKGILDLPLIDAALLARGVKPVWTIIGDGPDRDELQARWPASGRVTYVGQLTNAGTVERLPDNDVFVLPTRAEGFPVALIEAMAAGLVPVVSAIASGVPEVVDAGVTGLTPAVGDVAGFVAAIASLDENRDSLYAMAVAARTAVAGRFDIRTRVADYENLYARYADLYRPLRSDARLNYGSRLDRPWIPNAIVRMVRHMARRDLRAPRS